MKNVAKVYLTFSHFLPLLLKEIAYIQNGVILVKQKCANICAHKDRAKRGKT